MEALTDCNCNRRALISQNAAKDFKRVSLELGGKGANIIFKDADPEAIERGALRCFRNSGQSCNAPTRMLVEKSMYDEAVKRVKKFANTMKVGDPKKEGAFKFREFLGLGDHHVKRPRNSRVFLGFLLNLMIFLWFSLILL